MYCTVLQKSECASQSLLWITSYDWIRPGEPKHVSILCQYTRNFFSETVHFINYIKILHAVLLSVRVGCAAYLILFAVITLITSGEQHRTRNSSLCNTLTPPVSSSYAYKCLSKQFSDTHSARTLD
jgi:hypothetical protein